MNNIFMQNSNNARVGQKQICRGFSGGMVIECQEQTQEKMSSKYLRPETSESREA